MFTRGTLMVLKRFLISALGALGLGALVAGSVSAQQIPAPDFYGDATACANGFPEPGTPGKMHAIDDATKDKTSLTIAALRSLNGMSMECDIDNEETANTVERDEVAKGLDKARELYEMAANAIELYEANDTEANKNARDDAVKARDDFAGGDDTIYARVYAEKMARAAFLTSGETWNDANKNVASHQELVEKVEYKDFIGAVGFDTTGGDDDATQALIKFKFVEDIDPDTIGDQSVYLLTDAGGKNVKVNHDEDAGTYSSSVTTVDIHTHAGEGEGADDLAASEIAVLTVGTGDRAKRYVIVSTAATGNDATIAITDLADTSIEVAEGKGIRVAAFVGTGDSTATPAVPDDPFMFGDHSDFDADTPVEALRGLNSRVKAADELYTDAKEAAEANKSVVRQPGLDEEVRKAKAVKDALDAQAATALDLLRNGKLGYSGNNPLTDATETGPQNYSTDDYRAYKSAQDSVSTALRGLRNAYDGRARATKAVEDGLKDTGSYLKQLVALRNYDQAKANAEAEDADEDDLNDDGLTEGQVAANKALMTAEDQLKAFNDIQGLAKGNPVKDLVNSLLVADNDDGDDDGQALVKAISANYEKIQKVAADMPDAMDTAGITKIREAIEALTADADDEGVEMDGPVTANAKDIDHLQQVVGVNSESQHGAATDCAEGANTLLNQAACNKASTDHNAGDIGENKTAIESNDMDMILATAIDAEAATRGEMDMMLATAIADEEADRMEADTAIRGEFAAADTAIRTDFAGADSMVRSDLTGMINSNTGMITDNRNMIGELSDDLDVVRSGVAASMALAGMPAVNGRGIAIGVGSFDGESAFAVGFQIAGEQASFKVGVTSSGGATGASAGVGFNF